MKQMIIASIALFIATLIAVIVAQQSIHYHPSLTDTLLTSLSSGVFALSALLYYMRTEEYAS